MFRYLFEIQNKSVLLIITAFSTLLVCYCYKDVLLFLVTQMHLNNENFYFIFTDVTELFSVYLKLVFFISIQIIIWYVFYHFFSFLRPALYFQELKFISFFFSSVTFFWLIAVLLSSYVLVPFGWDFFLSFQSQQGFHFEARISEYFSFYSSVYYLSLTYCQFFTLLFFFFTDVKKNYSYIKKYRKLYYYIFLIFATFVTPPDLISQILVTFFAVMVYEVILLISIFTIFLTSLDR